MSGSKTEWEILRDESEPGSTRHQMFAALAASGIRDWDDFFEHNKSHFSTNLGVPYKGEGPWGSVKINTRRSMLDVIDNPGMLKIVQDVIAHSEGKASAES